MTTGLWNMDSGLTAARRPGVTSGHNVALRDRASEIGAAAADFPIAVAGRLGPFRAADFARPRRLVFGRLVGFGLGGIGCVGGLCLHPIDIASGLRPLNRGDRAL